MSARDRVQGLVGRGLAVVREDARSAAESDHSVLHGLRFLAEIPATLGLALRALCHMAAAVVAETMRLGADPVFDDTYEVTMRWSWLGPGWDHNRQTRWELRLGAVFCVVTGFVFYETLAYFPLSLVERSLLWTTCGALVLDPAWTRIYLSTTSDELPSEASVWEQGAWPPEW